MDTAKVAFVLLSLDDDFNKVIRFTKSKRMNLPLYYPAENLPSLFNVPGIPATFIFSEKGALLQQIEGGEDYDSDRYRKLLR